ncbi:hypothetical protein CCAN2_1870044 [Capnocytophaga canimorsus]|uniref:Uncharacterized protein n=1 Tax=Capnocytophaga canimorsus TaxID=28188 RepID=A0A0B7IBK2_9FLAO|nr:hypothetical protein CCAN2_1870044 [Capnocytophaga canimorsus]CEN49663.1 hypothetical protein CCAN11_1980005 [Capnocytophaga canimorsus]
MTLEAKKFMYIRQNLILKLFLHQDEKNISTIVICNKPLGLSKK